MLQVPRFVTPKGFPHSDDYAPEEGDYGAASMVPLPALQSRLASLILGEPGSGKSTALAHLLEVIRADGTYARLIDLRDCSSEGSLERAFDDLEGSGTPDLPRVLLLDSVDETPGLIRNYLRFLERRLSGLTTAGWRVIAACRTAESVKALDLLFEHLEENAVHVLLPLRKADAAAIATAEGIDSADFMDQVRDRRLDSLAAIPFTLNLLCKVYNADSNFPPSRGEIFERAIALIMAQDSVNGYTPTLPTASAPMRAQAAAERMAAFSVVAELPGFGLFNPGEVSSGSPTELLVGVESIQGVDFSLANEDLQNLLRSPLFSDSGANQRQFAHRRLKDYLAARFLNRHPIEESQLRSILLVADGNSVPPQMIDIATWLVILDPTRFNWILEADAFSLVRNRITHDLPAAAPVVVDQLFDRAFEVDRTLSWRDDLSGLEHSGLAAQIAQALSDEAPSQVLALRILNDSYVEGLEDQLGSIVDDRNRQIRVRKLAVEVLAQHGVDSKLAGLDPTAAGFFDGDDHAELRGAVLAALWPRFLTVDVLIELLVNPPASFFGSYSIFLRRLETEMTPEVAESLVLSNSLPGEPTAPQRLGGAGRGLGTLIDASISSVVERSVVDDALLAKAVGLLVDRVQNNREKLPFASSRLPDGRRRQVLEGVVRQAESGRQAWYGTLFATDGDGSRLLEKADLDWMEARAAAAESDGELETWAGLIDRFLDSTDPVDVAWVWAQRSSRLWPTLRYRLDAVDLNSDQARTARENWSLVHSAQRDPGDRSMSVEDYVSSIQQMLVDVREAPDKFWYLARWLAVDLNAGRFGDGLEADLLTLPNLELLGGDIRQTVLELALTYLRTPGILPARLKRNTLYFSVRAAYQALHTLEVNEPALLNVLTPADWSALNLAILESPLGDDDSDGQAVRRRLLDRSRIACPTGLETQISAFMRRIASGVSNGSSTRELDPYLSASAIPALQAAIRGSAHRSQTLFEQYLRLFEDGALGWARRRISRSLDASEVAALLGSILDKETELGFRIILDLTEQRVDFSKLVLLEVAARERYGQRRMHQVDPTLRIEIFERLSNLFPRSDDESVAEGIHEITPRADLSEWREGMLQGVVAGGTRDGLHAVVALARRSPEVGLEGAVAAAREAYRVNGWLPLSVDEFRKVLALTGAKLARSNTDLLDIVVRALGEIQDWLRGETPQSFALWDVTDTYRSPKDENRISDWYYHALRVMLDRSGLIINREVEVKNTSGRGVGQRQDIRVEVKEPETGDHFVTVIEVKGIWNSGVKTNLVTQLAGDYLVGGGLTHGIYLVVTFDPLQITAVAKAAASKTNLRRLEETLAVQARSLDKALTVIPVVHNADLPS